MLKQSSHDVERCSKKLLRTSKHSAEFTKLCSHPLDDLNDLNVLILKYIGSQWYSRENQLLANPKKYQDVTVKY